MSDAERAAIRELAAELRDEGQRLLRDAYDAIPFGDPDAPSEDAIARWAQRGTELVRIAARMEAVIDACWLRCDVCGLIERGCAASKPLPCYGRGAGTVGHQPCAGVFREIGRRIGP